MSDRDEERRMDELDDYRQERADHNHMIHDDYNPLTGKVETPATPMEKKDEDR